MQKRMAFKFELRPTREQASLIAQFAGCRRYIYNKALALQIDCYDCTGKQFSYGELCQQLTLWKKDPEFAWLNHAPSQSLQQALKDLETAYQNFFNKTADFPTRKKKGKSRESFRIPQGFKINEGERRIFLPKIGWVRYYQSRKILGKVKNVTVSTAYGRCFVSVQTEQEVPVPETPKGPEIGIDRGIVKFAQLSDGQTFAPINAYKKARKALAKAQKALSRKKLGSKNRAKAKKRVAKIHRQIANIRKDFLHKLSTLLCKNHAVIVIEDLKIENMTKSAKGTKENPSKNVKQKSGLNRSILDQGGGEFARQLEYKSKNFGGELIKVDPKHTSQKCSGCGHTCKENRKSQAEFCCVSCGLTLNADLNAAINILARGHRVIACRDTSPIIGASAQETTEEHAAYAA